MTAFVILAAGPGTRMGRAGDSLHKALVPLDGKAVISHQIGLAPPGARIIVCTGYRAAQVRGYLELAHPGLDITYVPVKGWDQPGGGPGHSLLAAAPLLAAGEDLIFTSCDTLWESDPELWASGQSWAGVAPVPAGTPPERWCRISSERVSRVATGIYDKTPGATGGDAYTGLARIKQGHLHTFWEGITAGGLLGGERQVTGGLEALIRAELLTVRRLTWTDIGDEAAYGRAVAARSGYNWAKPGEVTYVLPEQGRVVKYSEDPQVIKRSVHRQFLIAGAVPPLTGIRPGMLAYEFVPGMTGYEAAESVPDLVPALLDSAAANLWRPVEVSSTADACGEFYLHKTYARIQMLRPGLRKTAKMAFGLVRATELLEGCEPVTFHGDFNLGNVIMRLDGGFTWIDWREDFAGQTAWGDRRYDLGKLAAGMIVHWGNARRGDFRPWAEGGTHLAQIGDWLGGKIPHDVMVIAALSLINCAPLHAAPLDEVLVARGAGMLEELS